MGNGFSKDKVDNICPICKISVKDNNIFIDIACIKCKKRIKGYYHKTCLKKL
jgi:hypothetical protein